MPSKKQITPKKPVSKKVIAKKAVSEKTTQRTSESQASKTTGRKAVSTPKTPSLVNAVPLSTVSPKKPEQLLYEPEMGQEEKDAQGSAVTEMPKRGRGRPRKNLDAQPMATSSASPSPGVAQPIAAKPVQPVSAPAQPVQHAVTTPASPHKQLHRGGLRINGRLLVVLTLFIVLVAGSWYWHVTHAEDTAGANARLIAEIGKHAVLPQGETPTISTVVDTTKVNQDFLKNAKKGDKVLLYFQSSQAIVYRPSTGQVVNMGPLQTPRPRVFIRQGSTVDNVAAVKNLISSSTEFLVASQDQSPKKDYDKTIVVDLTGNRPDLAGQLAQLLHVNVGNLPAGEIPPDADLMVIVGSDFK